MTTINLGRAAVMAAALANGCNHTPRDEGVLSTTGVSGGQTDGANGGGDGHADGDGTTTGSDDSPDGDDGDGTKLDVGGAFDLGTPDAECPGPPPSGDATLQGTVLAPNGELPIAGAVVWVTDAAPEGIPDHVYCEACVSLPCETPHTLTEPDGTFSLSVPSGPHYLVVQKGQFMRATEIVAEPGDNAMDLQSTTLPDHRDADAMMWTPNIALAWGSYDRLEDGLAKLGLGELSGGTTLTAGTERFDIWTNASGDPAPPASAHGSLAELLSDPEAMADYHIIFVPCSSSPHTSLLSDPAIANNIRDWVDQGGKWYVSDWSLAFLDAPFGQYQTFWDDAWTGTPLLDSFDTVGTVVDDELMDWLDALPPALQDINPINPGGGHPTVDGLPQIELVDLWSTIKDTPPVLVDDGEGGQVDVGHKVWIEGPGGGGDGAPSNQDWPMAVTGEYGCGRIMFTSYHTVEWTDAYQGLTPQELVLMYLILEIGVCQVPYAPPPAG